MTNPAQSAVSRSAAPLGAVAGEGGGKGRTGARVPRSHSVEAAVPGAATAGEALSSVFVL